MHVLTAAVDSGGHHSQSVYDFCRRKAPNAIAIKGQSQTGKPIIGHPTLQDISWNGQKIPNGIQLWPVGSDTAKGVIYSRLKITQPGPGFYHFPIGIEDQYFLQLTAEKLVTRYIKGFPKMEWVLTGSKNEALDCEVYAYAAALRAGLQHMNWDALENREPPKEEAKTTTVVEYQQPQPVARSQWMQPDRSRRW